MFKDFIYDNRSLSSFGFIVCNFDSDDDIDAVTTDSQREISSLSLFQGKFQPFASTAYSDKMVFEFSCCKNVCWNDELDITVDEMRDIKHWLTPPVAKKFEVADEPEYYKYYWEGIFNVQEVWFEGRRVGFNLTLTCNRPFGLLEDVEYSGTLEAGGSFSFDDSSDDQGYIYPSMTIKCLQAGNLTLKNTYDNREMIINNCEENEVITVTPELQIFTSLSTHKLSKDFNWKFLRIGNTLGNRKNTISSSLKTDYDIKYNPIRKAVIPQ